MKFIEIDTTIGKKVVVNIDDISFLGDNVLYLKSLIDADPEYIEINKDLIKMSFELSKNEANRVRMILLTLK